MYKQFEEFIISSTSITFKTLTMPETIQINIPSPMSFTEKDCSEQQIFEGKDSAGKNYNLTLFKNNLIIKSASDALIGKFYMPGKIKHLITKDIIKKGSFSLTYRKHLRKEYDANQHVLVKMNYIPEEQEHLLERAQTYISKYSKGINNQPILVCHYDDQKEELTYAIIKDNIILENGKEQ